MNQQAIAASARAEEQEILNDDEWKDLLLFLMEECHSNSCTLAEALQDRRPAQMTAERWEEFCIIANDYRELEAENLWETKETAMTKVDVLYDYTMRFLTNNGYAQDGRYQGTGPEPRIRSPTIYIPQIYHDGRPYTAGFSRVAYRTAWKAVVERFRDRTRYYAASPKRLKQAVETNLFYIEVVDVLSGA